MRTRGLSHVQVRRTALRYAPSDRPAANQLVRSAKLAVYFFQWRLRRIRGVRSRRRALSPRGGILWPLARRAEGFWTASASPAANIIQGFLLERFKIRHAGAAPHGQRIWNYGSLRHGGPSSSDIMGSSREDRAGRGSDIPQPVRQFSAALYNAHRSDSRTRPQPRLRYHCRRSGELFMADRGSVGLRLGEPRHQIPRLTICSNRDPCGPCGLFRFQPEKPAQKELIELRCCWISSSSRLAAQTSWRLGTLRGFCRACRPALLPSVDCYNMRPKNSIQFAAATMENAQDCSARPCRACRSIGKRIL